VPEPKDVSAQALRALTWEQGSLVPDDAARPATLTWAHPQTQALGSVRKAVAARRREGRDVAAPVAVERAPRKGERLAVTTQTCDILKDAVLFPQVEVARVFETRSVPIIADAQNLGSARYFRLNAIGEPSALILDFGYRTHFDKGFLVEHDPDNSVIDSWDIARRRTFARWLGRRYSRPVLSDEDDERVARPVRERWTQLVTEEPEVALRCSGEYAEFRFRYEEDGSLTMFLLSPNPQPNAEIALEIAAVLAEVLEPIHGVINFPSDRRSYHVFTVADQLTTEQIDLDWASHEEGDISGEIAEE
jgi:hypothetical protein